MPERNEEVRANTHAFPTKEGNEQVFTKHQHQHGEHEQVEVQKELGELWVAVHIPNGIQVNERTDTRDEQRHGDGQWVCEQRNINVQSANRDP